MQSNALSLPPASAPPAHSPPCETELPSLIAWRDSRGFVELRRELTDGERGLLEAHEEALAHALAPFGEGEEMAVRSAISGMLSGFRMMRQEGLNVVAVTEVVFNRLKEFPAWAIAFGCDQIAKGKAGLDRRFAPNDGEVYSVVEEVVRWSRTRQDRARQLLSARVEATEPRRVYPRAPSGHLASVGRWRTVPPAPMPPERAAAIREDLAARKVRNEERATVQTMLIRFSHTNAESY